MAPPPTMLAPRQMLTPTPYAIYSGAAGIAAGVAPGSVTGAGIAPGTITAGNIAPGQVMKSLNGFTDNVSLSPGPNMSVSASGNNLLLSVVPAWWNLGGNNGTSPTNGNFIGTLDFQPLELKAGGMRLLRLEPDPRGDIAGNLIGGSTNNVIEQPGSGGNFIVGGGYLYGPNIIHSNSQGVFIGAGSAHQMGPNVNDSFIGAGYGNTILAFDSVINGGQFNSIQIYADHAVIGGGAYNNIIGSYALPVDGTIAGGYANLIQTSVTYSSIGGGYGNTIAAGSQYGTVGGGFHNTSSGKSGAVPGGQGNLAAGDYSLAAGYAAGANHNGAFVWSDASDALGFSSTASNQFNVRALGGVRFVTAGAGITIDGVNHDQTLPNDTSYSNMVNVVDGSPVNFVAPGTYGATISGGGALIYNGTAYTNSVASDVATVAGGAGNTIAANSAGATISGGSRNHVQSGSFNAIIAGGVDNTVQSSAFDGIISGGQNNTIQTAAGIATIGGGYNNIIRSGGYSSTI